MLARISFGFRPFAVLTPLAAAIALCAASAAFSQPLPATQSQVVEVIQLRVPFLDAERHLVEVVLDEATPASTSEVQQ